MKWLELFELIGSHTKFLSNLVLLIGIIIYLYHVLYFQNYIDDDAGISFTYARNFANGYGLVLNPGGEHVEGYSNFLWVFLLSIFIKVGVFDPIITPKILAIIFGISTFIILYKLPKIAFSTEPRISDSISVILLSASTPYVVWNISGLENSLFIFLIIAATYFYVRELNNNLFPFSSFFFVCIALTRPEGIMYFIVAAIHKLVYISFAKNLTRKDLSWFTIFLLLYGIYFVWHYQYFSYFVPNTYYAKAPGGSFSDRLFNLNSSGWMYVRSFFIDYKMYLLVLFIPSLLIVKRFWTNSILVSIAAATIFYPVYVGGDWMAQYRFLTPFLPFGYIFIQEGIKEISDRLLRISGRKTLIKSAIVNSFIIIILIVLISPSIAFSQKTHANPTVPFEGVSNQGKYFKSLAEKAFISDTASLMVPDLGGNSYYSGLWVIDYAGLADIAIAHHGWAREFFEDYVFNETKPTFLHIHGAWTLRAQIDKFPQLWTDYVPISMGYWKPVEPEFLAYSTYSKQGTLFGDFVRKDVFVARNITPENTMHYNFNTIELQGFNLTNNLTKKDGKIHYTFFWKCLNEMSNDYNLVLHISQNEKILYQTEYSPIYGWYPTSKWIKGEILKEEVDIMLPEIISEGKYNVSIRVVDTCTCESEGQEANLGPIEVNNEKTIETAQSHYDKYLKYDCDGEFEAALDEIKDAIVYHPENISYKNCLNNTYVELSNLYYEHAEQYIRANNIKSGTYFLLKAKQINRIQDNVHVRFEFKNMSEYYYVLAMRLEKEYQLLDAINYYKLALQLNPGNSRARHRLEDIRMNSLLFKQGYILNNITPNIENKINANIDDMVIFLGYNISSTKLQPGDNYDITYYWKCIQQMKIDYRIFVHLTNNTSNAVGLDHSPLHGIYPTSKWKPGEIVVEHYNYILPENMQPGIYDLRLGLWYPPEGHNLKVINTSMSDGSNRIVAGSIEIIKPNKTNYNNNSWTIQENLSSSVMISNITWDFETGDLHGWTIKGDAFESQPTYGDNPVLRGLTSNHQGNYWIGTFENRSGPSNVQGQTQGDTPRGTLTSNPFIITQSNISFLIGGGCAGNKVSVDLVSEGKVVLRATGKCNETMERVKWNVSEFIGKRAQIELRDCSNDSWGHINFDDLRFENNQNLMNDSVVKS